MSAESTIERQDYLLSICPKVDFPLEYKSKDSNESCEDYRKASEERLDNLVHRQLLCEITARIRNDIKQARGSSSANLNYFISGVRGSGKTTFLNYVIPCLERKIDPFKKGFKRCEESDYLDDDQCMGDIPQCSLLCRFDPSNPDGTKYLFFLTIVSALKSVLNESEKIIRAQEYCKTPSLEECKDAMEHLDKGVARLSQGKSALKDLTAHEVSQLRRDQDEMDEQLRKNFSKVVESLCRIRNVDAFIIAIDDADTRSVNCSMVMENLRLYIQNPRIVVLLAGDKELYLEHIKEMHFSEYDKHYHDSDIDGQKARLASVSFHANQYIIKLFPLSHQYVLKDLYTLLHKLDLINIKVKQPAGYLLEDDIEKLVSSVFQEVISPNALDVEPYVNLFLKLPLRSIVQVLRYWHSHKLFMLLNAIRAAEKTEEETLKKTVSIPSIVRMSINLVLENEIPVASRFKDPLADGGRQYYALLLRHCQNMGDLEHGYFLSGDMGATDENKFITMLLAVSFRYVTKGFDGFLSYLLFGPATVSLYSKAVDQYRRKSSVKHEIDFKELQHMFDGYLHVGRWNSPTRWARHANRIWCFDAGLEGLHSGILHIRQERIVRIIKKYVEEKLKGGKEEYSKALALYVSMSFSADRDNSYYISIFSLLAFILRCYQICKTCVNDDQRRGQLKAILDGCRNPKACINPEWLMYSGGFQSHNNEIIGVLNDFHSHDENTNNPFVDNIIDWYDEDAKAISNIKKRDGESGSSEPQEGTCANDINRKHYNNSDDISFHGNMLTPQVVGRLWSDFYREIRSMSHGVKCVWHNTPISSLEDKVEIKNVMRACDNHTSHFAVFVKIVERYLSDTENNRLIYKEIINQSMISQEQQLLKYRYMIERFPLTMYFLKAMEEIKLMLDEKIIETATAAGTAAGKEGGAKGAEF